MKIYIYIHKCRFKTEAGRILLSLTFGKNAGATFTSSLLSSFA